MYIAQAPGRSDTIVLTHGFFLCEDAKERQIMRPYPPLGVLYLSAYLKQQGFRVDVFDSTFSSRQAFEEHLRRVRPPLVGIYANMMTRASALRQMQLCKRHGARVLMGGPDPANYADEYLRRGADVVVIGEGEQAMRDLVPRLAGGGEARLEDVPGIVFRASDGAFVRTRPRAYIGDLDALPYPDREAIDIEAYIRVWRQHHGQGAVSLITARGCPYQCKWCSHAVFGYSYRRRSVANVVGEVEQILDRYKPDMLWYADDVFTLKPSWFYSYAEELARRGIRIPFETISREDRLDEDVVKTLAEMGCFRLWVGSESGSQRVLDRMQRRTDAERVVEVVHMLKNHGIEAGMFIMVGYDKEEIEDIEITVERLKQARPDRFLSTLAYPIKNTPYYQDVAEQVVATKEWETSSDRDLTVAGRHSKRFYQHAMRWMHHEVDLHEQRHRADTDYAALARSFCGAKASRLGMWLTKGQVEAG